MSDYSRKRIMELAGLKRIMVEDSQTRITSADVEPNEQDSDEARYDWECGVEKNIKLIARRTGVELWDNFPVYFDDSTVEVKIDTGSGMPLSHLLQFASQLAANGIGSDVKIQGSADLFITITMTVHG